MKIQILILLAICFSGSAIAGKVIKATPKAVLISHDEAHRWKKGEKACFYDGDKKLGCGKVVKVAKSAAMVKFDNKKNKIQKGFLAELYTPDIEDRLPASHGETIDSTGKRKKKKPSINLTGGFSGASGLFNPYINVQIALSDHIAFGLRPHFFKLSNPTSALSSVGGFGTINIYLKDRFKGLWLQAGGGMFSYSISDLSPGGATESAKTIALVGTAGWRFHFASGFNIGLGAGMQYLGDFTSTIITANFTGAKLVFANIEAGFTF